MNSHGHSIDIEEDKPCRACTDFKTWAKSQKKSSSDKQHRKTSASRPNDCPLDKEELGRNTWSLLHTIAAYYPEKPSKEQQTDIVQFFNLFSKFYPCEPCALDFSDDIKKHPPTGESSSALAKWLCDRHNTVNEKLGKPKFDCSRITERWKDGWNDGSCD